ncbi:hypothetical protein DV515_00008250 [Chloebia gouldiae]|uniref:Uncharacterized protein n=1 Tax=Chloebia gouldiae TaxID=44316 RepID=A0A3L8SGH4_CHLGU|nr:hypothetical protein DV515_00008250 [Chloebia gouldiae]
MISLRDSVTNIMTTKLIQLVNDKEKSEQERINNPEKENEFLNKNYDKLHRITANAAIGNPFRQKGSSSTRAIQQGEISAPGPGESLRTFPYNREVGGRFSTNGKMQDTSELHSLSGCPSSMAVLSHNINYPSYLKEWSTLLHLRISSGSTKAGDEACIPKGLPDICIPLEAGLQRDHDIFTKYRF